MRLKLLSTCAQSEVWLQQCGFIRFNTITSFSFLFCFAVFVISSKEKKEKNMTKTQSVFYMQINFIVITKP